MLIEHLKAKPAPFMYLDPHAGRGRYDLSHAQPQRSGEYLGGIGRLLKAPAAGVPAGIAGYLDLGRGGAGSGGGSGRLLKAPAAGCAARIAAYVYLVRSSPPPGPGPIPPAAGSPL